VGYSTKAREVATERYSRFWQASSFQLATIQIPQQLVWSGIPSNGVIESAAAFGFCAPAGRTVPWRFRYNANVSVLNRSPLQNSEIAGTLSAFGSC
jgi:hypothetical protein